MADSASRLVSDGITTIRDGNREPFEHPRVHPYWKAFDRAMAETP